MAPRYWVEPADPAGTQWDTFDKLNLLRTGSSNRSSATPRQVGITAFSAPIFDDEAVDFLASLDVRP